MGTNCVPLLADLFLYSSESEFLQKLVKDKKIHEARAFNLTYMCMNEPNFNEMLETKENILSLAYIMKMNNP
jgi:hypothetical protein